MKETLEREIKLAPEEGFVLPELGGAPAADAGLHLDLPRHAGPAARAARRHLPAPRRGRRRPLAAEAAARRGPPRARARRARRRGRRPSWSALLPAYLRGAHARPGRPPAHAARGDARPRAPRSSTTASPCSRASGSSRRFREVEVELLDGDERTLRRLEKELRKAGAHATGELQPKLYRALDLAGAIETRVSREEHAAGRGARDRARGRVPGAARARPRHAPRRRPGGPAPAPRRDAAAAGVPPRRARRSSSASGPSRCARSSAGSAGTSGRRATSTSCSSGCAPRSRRSATTPTRPSGLLAALEDDRAAAYRDVVETLGGERYFALLDRLEAAAEPPLSGDETTLTKIFHREAKRMRRTFEALGDDPEDDALHASRIAVKRARYAADLAAHELGKPGARFVAVAKQLQDILGDHQDAVVAQERIRDWAASTTAEGSTFAAGRLVQLERDRMAAARAAWPDSLAHGSTRRPGGLSAERGRAGRRRRRRPRRRGRARGAPRPPAGLRRLDVPEGQGRARRERRGVRRARGRGGDRPALRARARARSRRTTTTPRDGRSACATG